jgi:hypothetical protein
LHPFPCLLQRYNHADFTIDRSTWVQDHPQDFTETYSSRYILDPTVYNASPITTPLYNHHPDNTINLPQQYFHSILRAVSSCSAFTDSATPFRESIVELAAESAANTAKVCNYVHLLSGHTQSFEDTLPSAPHRFIASSTPSSIILTQQALQPTDPVAPQVAGPTLPPTDPALATALATLYPQALISPHQTSFSGSPTPPSILQLAQTLTAALKQHPTSKPLNTLQALATTSLYLLKAVNSESLPAVGSTHRPRIGSLRFLNLVLQHFTSQPISPQIIIGLAFQLYEHGSVLMNLADLMLWKTNGDLFHSTISRTAYTLSNNTHTRNDAQIVNYKLTPADYHY